jgi:hypothetical protein
MYMYIYMCVCVQHHTHTHAHTHNITFFWVLEQFGIFFLKLPQHVLGKFVHIVLRLREEA